MSARNATRTGGEILTDQLLVHGVRQVFCVPGESYLAVLDAFCDRDLAVTVCRQEGGAAMMAEALGKLTGKPGVCFVTRGPGATNASAGIHIARQDSTPMILFVGQVARGARVREAFQELDYQAVFGSMAKWVAEIGEVARIPEFVSRAFATAMNGRPGPVVLALPEDMLTDRADVADAVPFEAIESWPGPSDMAELQKRLAVAERPLLLLGGSRWSAPACAGVARFAEGFCLPVATTFRRAHLFDALHPCYAGDFGIGPNPELAAQVAAADLLILLGTRFGEISSQSYSVLGIPNPGKTLVHVHPGPEELGRLYRPDLGILASPLGFAAALEQLEPPQAIRWREHTRAVHAAYLRWSQTPTPVPGSVNLGTIVAFLRERLPPDAVICNGAGNYSAWLHRFYRFRRYATQLGPTSGSMGYGLPAAVATKRTYPERPVLCFAGDGCFLMHGQEFATAVQYDLPIIVVVVDNAMYGTIRMHQEREYPARVSGSMLKSPDFAAYARAFGGYGITVEHTAEFPAAFEQAQRSNKPAIVHLKVDAEAITPTLTLAAIRARSLNAKAH
jgi:acetolactate synthase I/II/III large subunit